MEIECIDVMGGYALRYCILTKYSTSIKLFTIGELAEFYSTELEEKRTINVYLPATYQTDSTRKYNVIYLLDGSAEKDFILLFFTKA